MRRMLVTGAAGFIGTNFVHFWAEHHSGDAIVGLDALTYAGNLANLEPLANNERFTFIKGDIRDGDAVREIIKREGIDTIVHFAAESHVDRSIHGPDPFIDTNVRGTHELLKAARAAWTEDWSGGARRFHHISTDEVYGSLGPTAAPFTEDTAYAPNSPYAASKAGSDHLVRAYHHTYGLPVTTTNCSNNYGPYHFPEKLIPLTIVNALDGKQLPVYGDGLQVRDWLYVRDHCRGIERVLEKGRVGRDVQPRRQFGAQEPRRREGDLREHQQDLRSGREGSRAVSQVPGRARRRHRRADHVREGSAGPRSALRDRCDEGDSGDRLRTVRVVRDRGCSRQSNGSSPTSRGGAR